MSDAVFDLAVNRAANFRRGAGANADLETWHARTRFAARIDLGVIRAALASRPPRGEWHWQGGERGSWHPGKAGTP